MATTECRYQYFCNEITTILDGPDILPKISSYVRVIVESLNLNHPFEDRWACVLCFIIFFSYVCYLGLKMSVSAGGHLNCENIAIFSIHIKHWLNIYIPTLGNYLRTSLETALLK